MPGLRAGLLALFCLNFAVAPVRADSVDDNYTGPAPNSRAVKSPAKAASQNSKKRSKKKRRKKRRVRRTLASRQWRTRPPFRVGVEGTGDGLLGAVSGGLTSTGVGYGGGLHIMFGFARDWQITIGAGFRSLGLSNSLSASEILEDPAASSISQRQNALGVRVLVGYLLSRSRGQRYPTIWWVDAGAEFLYSLSASQSGTLSGSGQTYRPPNLLLVRLGPAGSLSLSDRWAMASNLHFYYNVASTAGSKLFGVQVSLALQLTL
ncbi:MAG: hypothetical protein R3B54_11235 [Bdellovibrionota bacterium]